jgi:hypothetical protein
LPHNSYKHAYSEKKKFSTDARRDVFTAHALCVRNVHEDPDALETPHQVAYWYATWGSEDILVGRRKHLMGYVKLKKILFYDKH